MYDCALLQINLSLLAVLEVANDAAVIRSYRYGHKQSVRIAPMFVLWCTYVILFGVNFLHNVCCVSCSILTMNRPAW